MADEKLDRIVEARMKLRARYQAKIAASPAQSDGQPLGSLRGIALQRVEVLSDGASSVYGSDAVAGVVNFITRPRYDGEEIQAQHGFGNQYDTANVSAIVGKTWDTGSAYVAYAFSDKSALQGKDRAYTGLNHLAQGGTSHQQAAQD